VAAAGLMWSAVGLMLCRLAFEWLGAVGVSQAVAMGAAGVLLVLLVYRILFIRIARRNIDRLSRYPARVCLFAFQAWKSYLLIGVMVTFGVILRHSGIPRHYLSVPYGAIGGALLLSSLHYYAFLWHEFF
jgi:ABC-type transport system involved in cytochrome c biogenesis permease component